MSGEKSEPPTAKRLLEARRKGQVAKSQDLVAALLLLTAVGTLWLSANLIKNRLSMAIGDHIANAASFTGELSAEIAWQALVGAAHHGALVLAPLLGAMLLVAGIANYLQIGSLLAFQSIKPDINKLNPLNGLKQKFFKSRAYLELLKSIIKMGVAGVVTASVLWRSRLDFVELTGQPAPRAAFFAASVCFEIGLKVGLVFLGIGAGDLLLQRHLHLKELKMTKQEVKEEHKETEGHPLLKNARRQLRHEMTSQSLMEAMRQATVIVVNPTHLAVALAYDCQTMSAPVVVARGAELMAAQMRRLAEEAGVPTVRDVLLARTLYELEIETEIPEELYEAVAVILRWAQQLKG
ncbi:MAG: EscU/YscU/HrcU family type III secretion system export apparatus switch protein [Pyrinomonadaceae bacterium]